MRPCHDQVLGPTGRAANVPHGWGHRGQARTTQTHRHQRRNPELAPYSTLQGRVTLTIFPQSRQGRVSLDRIKPYLSLPNPPAPLVLHLVAVAARPEPQLEPKTRPGNLVLRCGCPITGITFHRVAEEVIRGGGAGLLRSAATPRSRTRRQQQAGEPTWQESGRQAIRIGLSCTGSCLSVWPAPVCTCLMCTRPY
jgi:hypothetical protein